MVKAQAWWRNLPSDINGTPVEVVDLRDAKYKLADGSTVRAKLLLRNIGTVPAQIAPEVDNSVEMGFVIPPGEQVEFNFQFGVRLMWITAQDGQQAFLSVFAYKYDEQGHE